MVTFKPYGEWVRQHFYDVGNLGLVGKQTIRKSTVITNNRIFIAFLIFIHSASV